MKVNSNQIFFDSYDKIHIAFYHGRQTGWKAEETSNGVNYEGKLRIARIDALTPAGTVDYLYR